MNSMQMLENGANRNLRFPEKIKYLLENHPNFIQWSRAGTTILINITDLDVYLTSSSNTLFSSKTAFAFERQLIKYGFSKICTTNKKKSSHGKSTSNSTNKSEMLSLIMPIICEYRHHYFRADFIDSNDLCDNVRQIITPLTIQNGKIESNYHRCNMIKMKNDHCLNNYQNNNLENVNALNMARMRLKMLLQSKMLKNRIDFQLEKCMATNSYVIELPEDNFDNVTESLFDINQKKFAGYYGKVADEYVTNYFGSYLPMYTEISEDNTNVIVKQRHPAPPSQAIAAENLQNNYEFELLSPINNDDTPNVGQDNSFNDFTEIHYENENAESDKKIVEIDLTEFIVRDTIADQNGNGIVENDSVESERHKNDIENILIKLENGQCENLVSDDMFKEIRESINILYS